MDKNICQNVRWLSLLRFERQEAKKPRSGGVVIMKMNPCQEHKVAVWPFSMKATITSVLAKGMHSAGGKESSAQQEMTFIRVLRKRF